MFGKFQESLWVSKKFKVCEWGSQMPCIYTGITTLLIRKLNWNIFWNVSRNSGVHWGFEKKSWNFSKTSLGDRKVKVCKWGSQMPCIYIGITTLLIRKLNYFFWDFSKMSGAHWGFEKIFRKSKRCFWLSKKLRCVNGDPKCHVLIREPTQF